MIWRSYNPAVCQWCRKHRSAGDHTECIDKLMQAKAEKKKRKRKPRNLEQYYLGYIKPKLTEGH